MKNIKIIITLLILIISNSVISAETYLGVGLGASTIDLQGYDQGFFYKVYAGAREKYYGFEGSYIRIAKFDISGNNTGSISSSGIEASGMSFLPVSSNLELFVKVGILSWSATGTYNGGMVPKNKGNSFAYSFGGEYKLQGDISLRTELQRFRSIIGGDISSLSTGASFRF